MVGQQLRAGLAEAEGAADSRWGRPGLRAFRFWPVGLGLVSNAPYKLLPQKFGRERGC